MLSVNPASSGSSASSSNDSSSIAAFVSQNSIGILAVVHSPPQSVVATSGNAQLAVTWAAPASQSHGGRPVAEYLVKYSSNNGVAGSWTRYKPGSPITATSCTVMGLTNGTPYVIKVIAKDAAGISLPSANSAPATPAPTVPGSPTSVVAVSGNTTLAVTWVAPVGNGGPNITDYFVKYSSNNGSTWTRWGYSTVITATSCTVTGLTNGTPYVIKVIANNNTLNPWASQPVNFTAVGISPPSSNSAPATPLAAALTPAFGATTATADGFTAQISNYDSSYTWAGTATASGTVAISGTGLVTVTGLAAGTSSAATITTTKANTVGGSAAVTATSLVAMSMVTVGNAGNAADTTSYGDVSYAYQIGAYGVTGSQYAAFLNAVGSTDTYALYDANMSTNTDGAQISQSGSSGSYTYAVMGSTGNRPITVTWFDSARFSNWMSNNQPSGAQSSTTTEDGAYNLNGATSGNAVAANATNPNTLLAPMYRIPQESEWYKAAYYSPNYGGTGVGGYYAFATQSGTDPGTTIGSSANQANYNGAIGHLTDVGSFSGSGSFYGTFDQSGNVYQWNDLDGAAGSVRGSRGGDWTDNSLFVSSSFRRSNDAPSAGPFYVGFRLASPVTTTLTPTFGATTATADGFTVQITNYDSSYTWAGTATASGSVAIDGTGLVTVTGVAALTSSTATITTSKSNTVGGSAPVTATSLLAALTPTFGTPTATADGFTVVITNYDSGYTWAGTATASGTVVVTDTGSGTGLATINGLAAGTSSTATITTTQAGYAGGTANVTQTSLAAALTPTFGTPTATADGFTVQITNYDSNYTWAGTATASGTVGIADNGDGTGLATIIGVAAGTSSTATITTTRTGYAGGTANVTANSLMLMSMVTVGNVGNAADANTSSVYGAVSYAYQIGAYDVTGSQYTAFLNAVGSTDTYGLYNTSMGTDTKVAQISRSGTTGTYTYAVMNSTGSRPISYVSWFDSARFSNWMSNGQPRGAQTSTTTENGTYTLVNGAISGNAVAANATNPNTGLAPTYRIPLENEWYKAAFYKGGSTNAGYWTYATQSDSAPGTTIGSSANQANYNSAIGTATDVGSFSGSGSFYGTFDQSGNVYQWNDLDGTTGSSRGLRGGDWYNNSNYVSSSFRNYYDPSNEELVIGFRLASPVTTTLTPAFGSTTATADGFTAQISNYDSSYTWAGTATASGTVVVSSTGLVTVTGLAANTSSTATITTAKSNTVGGSATVTANSLMLMSMVTVGNPGNAADANTGSVYGAVSYAYQIGAYDVTGSQYTAFLNAVGSTDTYGLYDAGMGTDTQVAQISRSGTAGTYIYAVLNSTGSRPISYVSWFDSARFSNWMSNGQPRGAQTSTTTENGAYNLNGATTGNAVAVNATNPNTGFAPTFRMPLENEWYKAAYYSPNRGGTGVGGYYSYATQSNTAPGTTIGSSANQANYKNAIGHSTDVGAFSGSESFYGTFDQTGNVFQWNDLDGTAGSTRGRRGGGWEYYSGIVASSYSYVNVPAGGISDVGFRLASPV